MANNWTILLESSSATPSPLIVNAGDKITWTNSATNSIALTLPDCVSPNGGGLVDLPANSSSQSYTVNANSSGSNSYSWTPGATGSVNVVVSATKTAISLSPAGADPTPITVNPGDKVSWANNYPSGTTVELTLPNCIAPHGGSQISLGSGATSRQYTVNAQKGGFNYSWLTVTGVGDTGVIDVS